MNAIAHAVPQIADAPLLYAYREEHPFVFASPTQTMLVRSARSVPTEVGGRVLLKSIEQALAQSRDDGAGLVFGALPFDVERTAAHLMVAHDVECRAPLPNDVSRRPTPAALRNGATSPIEPGDYRKIVARALHELAGPALEKVVLSRVLEWSLARRPSPTELVRDFCQRNPQGYCFGLALPPLGGGRSRHLLGASPELLLRRHGAHVETRPLAGSRPRSHNASIDRRRSESLMASDKDRREHAIVVASIADALAPYCRDLHVPAHPHVITTSTMLHLATSISGELRGDASSAELALALHPTPAVCGHPREVARSTISTLEPFDREFFTGTIGWCDHRGNGEWAVTIRCMELRDNVARLFAGAGIVAGSTPESEWQETTAKLTTMSRALGVTLPGEDR